MIKNQVLRELTEQEERSLNFGKDGNEEDWVNLYKEEPQTEKQLIIYNSGKISKINRELIVKGKNLDIIKSVSCINCFEKFCKHEGFDLKEFSFEDYFKKFQNTLIINKIIYRPEYDKQRKIIVQNSINIKVSHKTPFDFCGRTTTFSFIKEEDFLDNEDFYKILKESSILQEDVIVSDKYLLKDEKQKESSKEKKE